MQFSNRTLLLFLPFLKKKVPPPWQVKPKNLNF